MLGAFLLIAAGALLGGIAGANAQQKKDEPKQAEKKKNEGDQNQKDDGLQNQNDDGQKNQNDNDEPKKEEKKPEANAKPEVAVLKRVNPPANLLQVVQNPKANNAQKKQGKLANENVQKKDEPKKDGGQKGDGQNQNDDGQKNQNDDGQKNQKDDGQVSEALLKAVNARDNTLTLAQKRQGKVVVNDVPFDDKVAVRVGNKPATLRDLKAEMNLTIKMSKDNKKIVEIAENGHAKPR
jgi:DNA mismatch repair ATPase MutL